MKRFLKKIRLLSLFLKTSTEGLDVISKGSEFESLVRKTKKDLYPYHLRLDLNEGDFTISFEGDRKPRCGE